jgi:hypothetical protein
MNRFNPFYLALAGLTLSFSAMAPAFAQVAASEPKNSIEWFSRASDRMNLRLPGCAPFHLKVTFHAYPGMELLGPKEKSDFISGDGVYEETWLAPHQWRREVTLASYHAIEVDSNGVRKMQASSDYEPSRVLTLLEALLSPIPRNYASKEFRHEGASGWKIEHVTTGNLSLVRISKEMFGNDQGDFMASYYFQPDGNLIMTNDRGLVTLREGAVPFAGKVVPKHLSIKAGKAGDRDLLEADLAIEAAQPNAAAFDLPGGPAEPGMTLRSLQHEIRMPDPHSPAPSRNLVSSVFSWQAVIDRHGRYREVEVLSNQTDTGVILYFLDFLRHDHVHPPEIDGFNCELMIVGSFA